MMWSFSQLAHFMSRKEKYRVLYGVSLAGLKLIFENFRQCVAPAALSQRHLHLSQSRTLPCLMPHLLPSPLWHLVPSHKSHLLPPTIAPAALS